MAAVSLAACSSNKSASPGTGSTTTAPGGQPSSTTGATSTTVAGTACAARDLAITVAGSQGAAGTLELTLALRNTSSAPCPMEGFPGAQLLGASGAELPTTVVRGGTYNFTNFPPVAVVLAPGATAYVNVGYSDVPAGSQTSCPTAAQVEITPPGAYDHDVVAQQMVVCDNGTLTVSPVFDAGSSNAHTTAPPQP